MFRSIFCAALFCVTIGINGTAADPVTVTITYPIVGIRSAVCSGVPIGEDLVLSCEHAIRDDKASIGTIVAFNWKYDWVLLRTTKPNEVWSELRRTPLQVGEIVHFNGGEARIVSPGRAQVLRGRVIQGMSGGPIWDSQDRVVAVVSSGDVGTGPQYIDIYEGAWKWVEEVTGKAQAPEEQSPSPLVDDLKAKLAELMAPVPKAEAEPDPKDVPYANGVLVVATWCEVCKGLEPVARNTPGVRVLDYDRDQEEIRRLFARFPRLTGSDDLPLGVPSFIRYEYGKPVRAWSGIDACKYQVGRFAVEPPPATQAEHQPQPGEHAHRCNACGTIWWHTEAEASRNPRSHNCPNCGRPQYQIYRHR